MTEPRDIRDDLEPDVGQDIILLAERLQAARPLPTPRFRGELGRRLAAHSRRRRLSPARARALIAAYSASGTLLLVVGAIGAAGH